MADKGALDFTRVDFEEIDTATYVAAKTFGAVALPLHISFAQAAAIETQANMAQSLDGAENFVTSGAGNDPRDGLTPEQRQKRKDDEAWEYLASVSAEAERRERREREEWAHTQSTVGGVTKTGTEWAELAERLQTDSDLRRRLVETFERQGSTPDEAAARVDRVTEAAQAASTPPAQRTAAQRAVLNDPSVAVDLRTTDSLAQEGARPRHDTSSLSGRFETAAMGTPEIDAQNRPPPTPRPVVAISPGAAF